jgi:hypothetical protein
MRAFVLQTFPKPFVLCILLTMLLGVSLWGLLQQPSNSHIVLAVDGEIRFINQHNVLLANRDIRLLCFHGVLDTSPDDIRFMTGSDGSMPLPIPAGCTHVAAMQLWHIQPSGKPEHGPAYWVYTTSWQPGSSNLIAIALDGPTLVTISDIRWSCSMWLWAWPGNRLKTAHMLAICSKDWVRIVW